MLKFGLLVFIKSYNSSEVCEHLKFLDEYCYLILLKYRFNYDRKMFYNTGQGCLFKAPRFINWYRVSPPISMLISHWHYL